MNACFGVVLNHQYFLLHPSALKFCFGQGSDHVTALPCSLIKETADALMYFFRNPDFVSYLSQNMLEYALRETVHALLDDRLGAANGVKSDTIGAIVKAINKVICIYFLLFRLCLK